MSNGSNLANPDFEPSDEQLQELSRRAFEGVPARRRAALARVHAEIAKRREAVLQDVRARLAGRKGA
ncbi:MAG: hypothetical protein HYV09_05950 [Deltaproteobacteria bacterium]|nr:hypothetical protein [Deltaproteobacteria bacterium]